MARKRYTPETAIRKLREAEILQGQGLTLVQAVKKFGISEQTFYRRRKEYGATLSSTQYGDIHVFPLLLVEW